MIPDNAPTLPSKISLPDIAALFVNAKNATLMNEDGEVKTLPHDQARLLVHKKPVLLCHAPFTRRRLGLEEFYAYDVLELFAFVHPGKFCVPSPSGLCDALGVERPHSTEDIPFSLIEIATALLSDLQKDEFKEKADPLKIAAAMGLRGKGWPWTPYIFEALGAEYNAAEIISTRTSMNVWRHLPEWAEEAPEPPPSHHGVTGEEARERLAQMLGPDAEIREAQKEYTGQVAATFKPPAQEGQPHVVLAEAGTGIGKTLGYLAPASVWAEKNQGTVWLSTYTKNLQRQIDQELDRLYPNPDIKNMFVAVRKGRENYMCLLNLEEASAAAETVQNPAHAVAAGLMARWAVATKDGDLSGADFPGWLSGLMGFAQTGGLADRRGECIYSACDHYSRCFVERSVRKARRARIVVANHALVMINAALSSSSEDMPGRYVFDEGHHLFDAADGAFAAHLSAQETRDLRRWILGGEGGKRSRARGLKRRVEDLIAGNVEAERTLEDIVHHADALTAQGWTSRMKDGAPKGPCEIFLYEVYRQVYARADGRDGPYSLETGTHPVAEEILEKSEALKTALKALQKPIAELTKIIRKTLSEDEGTLDADTRRRLDATAQSMERRGAMGIGAWVNMLETLPSGETPEEFVDWMAVERIDGRAIDVGMFRHHVDPMKPFASAMEPHLHGMAVTSATLRDTGDEENEGWNAAISRTGADLLSPTPHNTAFESPFDYPAQTKIFIINDVRKDDLGLVSGAYKTLFKASGGGALGLFTAISRLRAVHNKISVPLEEDGISLYGQHIDEMDPGTLVDIFRDDTDACLLGTDAVRDGVDVPGESLRLIVFDRVPWPRPTILHKARREAYGKRKYDEMMTRLKLKQAFGRLIRRAGDKGVFVMLDSMLPSRLHGAFPPGVEVQKVGLAEAANQIKEFLNSEQ